MRKRKVLHHVKKVGVDTLHLSLQSLVIILFLLGVIAVRDFNPQLADKKEGAVISPDQTAKEGPFFNHELFSTVTVEAKAYIVYDIVSGDIVASRNLNEELPLASITKVMTALTALSLQKNKDEIFEIEQKDVEGGYDLGLAKNQKWHLDELLKYMLIFSSNDAAQTIASHYGGTETFVAAMNSLSKQNGLTALFSDPAGRDERGQIGGQGTVLDAAKLFVIARTVSPEVLDATTKKRQSVFPLSGKLTGVPNTNQSIQTLPGAEGSKTGYTDLAGGNLGVIVDITIGRPVVIVVLGSSKEGRFRDVAILYETLQKSLTHVPINRGQ